MNEYKTKIIRHLRALDLTLCIGFGMYAYDNGHTLLMWLFIVSSVATIAAKDDA